MRYGITISGSTMVSGSPDPVMKELLTRVRHANDTGYASLWAGASYVVGAMNHFITLARLAAEAPRLEMGAVAILPLHPPAELAEQVATLDIITGGRFTLAAAQGWRDYMFEAYGIPRNQRLGRFLESLEVMRTLWGNRPATFHGKYTSFDNIPGVPAPIRKPYPRVLVAANGDVGIRRAARIADGWLGSTRATEETLARQARLYKEACKEAGVKPHVVFLRDCFVARTREDAVRVIRPFAEAAYAQRAALGNDRDLPAADHISRPFEEILATRFIVGSPDDCVQSAARYRELGADEVVLRMHWDGLPAKAVLEAQDLFASRVMPQVR